MGISEPGFICIKTESIDNAQRQFNKGSDMSVLVNISKHRRLERFLHFTILLSFFKYWSTISLSISLYDKTFTSLIDIDAYSELNRTSKMESFANLINSSGQLGIFGKVS